MKFDDLLAQYLYETKKLQLQGIGTFELDKAVNTSHEHDKGIYYPIEGLTFTYNTKEVTPEELIVFLVQKLGKIQPLVRSDLDSYLSNIKQFLNIGKPYTIEGVGTLNKNNQGTYEFTPGNFLPVKEELNPKRENPQQSLRPKPESVNGAKVLAIILIIVASLAVLGGIGWGISTFFLKSNDNSLTEAGPSQAADESLEDTSNITAADTLSTPVVQNMSPNDSVNYKMIFEITPQRKRAVTRTAQLKTLKINARFDSLVTNNVVRYRLFVPKRLKAADTLRVRDSIAKFFLKKVMIDKE